MFIVLLVHILLVSTVQCMRRFTYDVSYYNRLQHEPGNDSWKNWDDRASGSSRNTLSIVSQTDDIPFEAIDFCFPFYSFDAARVYVSANGFISLAKKPLCGHFCTSGNSNDGSYKITESAPGALEGGDHPMIAPYAEDLHPGIEDASYVAYTMVTKYGMEVLLIEWHRIHPFASETVHTTFQVELLPNGTMFFRYLDVLPEDVASPFIGLVWSESQRSFMQPPCLSCNATSGNTTTPYIIRVEPILDPCTPHVGCNACLANKCHWCGALSQCMDPTFNTSIGEFCPSQDVYTESCEPHSVAAHYHAEIIHNSPLGAWNDIAGDDPYQTFWSSQSAGVVTLEDPSGNFAFPFFYNPPEGFDPNELYTRVLVGSDGLIGFDKESNDAHPYLGLYHPTLTAYLPGSNVPIQQVSFSTSYVTRFTEYGSLIVQIREVTSSYAPQYHQTELYKNGTISFRFGFPKNSTETTDGCLYEEPWSAYPQLRVVLQLNSITRVELSWQILRDGLEVKFTLTPGCVKDCAVNGGVCNQTTQFCECPANRDGSVCERCAPGFFGAQCQECPTCANGGMCDEGVDGTGDCKCPSSYYGPQCDQGCDQVDTAVGELVELDYIPGIAREGSGSIVVGDKLFLIAGLFRLNGVAISAIQGVYTLDTITNKWEDAAWNILTPRYDFATAILGNRLYTLGGREVKNDFTTSPVTDTEYLLLEGSSIISKASAPPMNKARSTMMWAGVLDGHLVVVGGVKKDDNTTMEILYPTGNGNQSWVMSVLPGTPKKAAVVFSNDVMYVIDTPAEGGIFIVRSYRKNRPLPWHVEGSFSLKFKSETVRSFVELEAQAFFTPLVLQYPTYNESYITLVATDKKLNMPAGAHYIFPSGNLATWRVVVSPHLGLYYTMPSIASKAGLAYWVGGAFFSASSSKSLYRWVVPCPPGWYGDSCEFVCGLNEFCPRGFYGSKCDASCPGGHVAPCGLTGTCDEGKNGTGVCQDCSTFKQTGHWRVVGYGQCDECQYGWHGQNCDLPCQCVNGHCYDGIAGSGMCAHCDEGWAGLYCNISCAKECENGEVSCDVNGNGKCNCHPNYVGNACDACAEGYWGPDCASACTCQWGVCDDGITGTGKCLSCHPEAKRAGENCNHICYTCEHGQPTPCDVDHDGSCVCEGGWAGDTCSECKPGFAGEDCSIPCMTTCNGAGTLAPCNRQSNGQCSCYANVKGTECEYCIENHGGPQCDVECPESCPDPITCTTGRNGTGTCDGCPSGWVGQWCLEPCSCSNGFGCDGDGLMSGTGKCTSCATAHYGAECSACHCVHGLGCHGEGTTSGNGTCKECPPGRWGPFCKECPVCENNGQCDDGVDGFGQCVCKDPRWTGPNCDQCAPGHAGPTCEPCKCQRGTGCEGEGFVNGTGHCLACEPGFYGPVCERCPACQHGVCNHGLLGDGQCQCDEKWTGEICDHCAPGRAGPDCEPCRCKTGEGCQGEGTIEGSGWCEQCDSLHYGEECTQCPVCIMGKCDSGVLGTGVCQCSEGWEGPSCNQCAKGYAGYLCEPCRCVHGAGCSGDGTRTGHGGCTACLSGWTGKACDTVLSGLVTAEDDLQKKYIHLTLANKIDHTDVENYIRLVLAHALTIDVGNIKILSVDEVSSISGTKFGVLANYLRVILDFDVDFSVNPLLDISLRKKLSELVAVNSILLRELQIIRYQEVNAQGVVTNQVRPDSNSTSGAIDDRHISTEQYFFYIVAILLPCGLTITCLIVLYCRWRFHTIGMDRSERVTPVTPAPLPDMELEMEDSGMVREVPLEVQGAACSTSVRDHYTVPSDDDVHAVPMDDLSVTAKLDMVKECIVCMTYPPVTVILPCFHSVLCVRCARKQLLHCPVCRMKIESVKRIYT